MAGLMAFESSCAPTAGSEGSIENMFDSGLDLSPPSPRSLSEAAPAYFLIESDPPPLNSPARFPPPPNSGFPHPYHLNMTFFEGQPAPHHSFEHPSREPFAPYDHWPERIVSSASGYGLDSSTKFVSDWPLPSASYIDNSNHGTMTAEPLYPTIATSTQHPLSDSRSEPFVPRSFSSVQDYHSTVLPSSAVPSTSCASISSPHFSSSSPQTARPHFSSRFSFNPHASAFYPGMYSQNSYGPREDFSPYYEPSYISHLAPADFLSNSLQGVDSFHDASSRPVHSPESAPRPISSTAPSFFSGVHSFSGSSATLSNPIVRPQHVPSRTDYCGLTSSSDVSGVRESSCDFPPVSSLSFDMPVRRTSVFTPYDTTAASVSTAAGLPYGQVESPDLEEDDPRERILKESGTLLYHQHISPEEWRWNIYESQYEPLNVEGLLDVADCTSRRYRSTYNYFQGVDRIGPSCVNEAVGGDSNSLFALSILERSKFQSQGGPSLKLAASALAEMLATSGQSIMTHIASFPGTASSLPMGVTLPVVGASTEALEVPRFEERLPDDCCSSSGSVAVVKEANDASTPGGPTVNDPHSSCMLVENERGMADRMRIDLAKPDASGQSQNSTTARPLTTSLYKNVPHLGTSTELLGHRSFVSDASGGISQKVSASSTGLNLENASSESLNLLSTQILDVSPDTDSGSTRRVTTQPVGAGSSEDDASVSGPLGANVNSIDPSTSGPCHNVSSSRVESQVPVCASKNFDSLRGSVMTGISPTSFQALADPLVGAAPTVADELATKHLGSYNSLGLQTLNTVQTVPLQYSSLQSLSTSISHLTKVLLATLSSAMTQSDMAPIQETLQASILGLSECLLLEQAKVNQQPHAVATDCVQTSGLKDPVAQEYVPVDNALENSLLRCPGEAQDNGDRRPRKFGVRVQGQSSERGPSEEVRLLYNAIGSDVRGVNTAGSRTSLVADGFQTNSFSRESVDGDKKYFQVASSAKPGGSNSTTIPEPTDTFQGPDTIGEMDDILDYLREQDLVNIPALKKLIAAEKREEKLKYVIKDLREQLEFEREESRGAAYLHSIMQEDLGTCNLQGRSMSPVSKKVGGNTETQSYLTTTSLPGTDLKSALPSTSGTMKDIVDNLECEDGMGERPECHRKTISNEDINNVILKSCNKEDCNKIDIEATGVNQQSNDVQCSNMSDLEARLALLRGRWNMEEEFLSGTGSFIPDIPGRSDWDRANEGVNGSPSCGLNDEQLATSETSPRLTTHMLKQSEVLFNMDAAWNKGYDYGGSQYEGMESNDVEDKETQSDVATEGYDRTLSIEARASIIRSRSCRTENNDRGDSGGHGIFAGDLDSGSSFLDSGISGVSKSEQNRFEAVNDDGSDASLVFLGDSDIGHFQQAAAESRSPIPERENEVECMFESLSSDTEAVKSIIQSQDSEEESGWEHIRLPRQISK